MQRIMILYNKQYINKLQTKIKVVNIICRMWKKRREGDKTSGEENDC